MKTFIFTCIFFVTFLGAFEPITPLPKSVVSDEKKVRLGMLLFQDPILSKDNSTACISCHDIYKGGADSRIVSKGFDGKSGNIQSPTVFNAKYNFKQFWNGRANNLLEQADGPINNPAEHNMNPQEIEERLNASKHYKTKFKEAYEVDTIKYDLVLNAIVEFENTLITPNSKFDKYLRGEEDLDKEEKDGYILFKQYGCITCHNGLNIGGNSFQKMGTFTEYKNEKKFPDRSEVTNKTFKNVFKVPTLRNIKLTAPYFHDGSAKTLKEAIITMAKYNLGIELEDDEIKKIIKFLNTLTGEKPQILESNEKL
jgi:cytochrome c peroxidase